MSFCSCTLVTCLKARNDCLKTACAILLIALACPVLSQTYQVSPGGQTQPANRSGQSSGQQLGWGSNIENARLARAAQLALQRGDHATALEYAQRAAQSAPNDPQLWFLLGYAARLDQRYGQSVSAFEHGLRLDPSSLNGQSGLAQTFAIMGRTAEAETMLKKVLAAEPAQIDDLLILGNLYLQQRDYPNAQDYLTRAERAQPNARSELLLAIVYERQNNMAEADRYLQMAKSRAPNNPDVERSLAGYYRDTGDYAKAIVQLKAIRNPPPDVVGELAYTYQVAGQPQDAARYYEQAANAMPRDLNMQLSAAQAQVSINDFDHAADYLGRAEKIDPNYYRLHAIRAEIAQQQDRDDDAAKEYQLAIANLPASPAEGVLYPIQLHMDLQTLYQGLGESDQAQQQLQLAAQQIAPLNEQGADRAAFLRLRALIEMNEGQEDSALNDMKASLALSPHDPNSLLLDGDVLMKLGRNQDAIAVYKSVLDMEPRSRFALTSLGYASRAAGDDRQAERYFERLAQDYPHLYVPYLALGDLYTDRQEYSKAEGFYAKGYQAAPKNVLIVAGGANAAIEEHDMPLAARWIGRAGGSMATAPPILAQKERYFNFKGNYQESADLGHQAIQSLPHNRDVVVYLGYDLLNLNQDDELLALTQKYMDVFPKEPDIPLLQGYVYKHKNDREQAIAAFTEALKRDPTVETAYVNRGFVENDLREPQQAQSDFEIALKSDPKDGQAHLGLAFASLALNHSGEAVRQSELAQQYLGDSGTVHVIRATAYGREGLLARAADEYRAAIRFTPDDGSLYLSLGNVYFGQQRYRDALAPLNTAKKYLPDDAQVYAQLARSYAGLQDKQAAMENIQLAERYAAKNPTEADAASYTQSDIYVSTGEALDTIGYQSAAMQRFTWALTAPKSDRVAVRLAIAQLMTQQGHGQEAERQIALAQMEAEAGATEPPTGQDYLEASNILEQLHEYQLSENYLQRAQAAGASDIDVRVDLANDYLALGDTSRAAAELAAVSQADGSRSDYSYLLAQANVYEQENKGTKALSAFAEAASASGEDQTAEQQLLQTGANEGYRITPQISVLSNLMQQPIYEDSTVYVLDAKTFGNPPAYYGSTTNTSLLPLPRYSIETDWTDAFHLHFGAAPTAGGFFQIRNARGLISVPAIGVVNRDTTDYNFNLGVAPAVHIGSSVITFNSGMQATVRRDSLSPREMNQNIGRVFTFASTSSFFNAVSVDGYIIHDFGPFTEIPLNESTLAGAVDFRVGSPWSKTALITGWGANDQKFTSSTLGNTENYYTSSYIGLTRRFSTHLNIEGIAEDLRSWRVVPYVIAGSGTVTYSGTAQALRPAGTIDFSPTRNWDVQFQGAYEDTRSFHLYDMTQNGLVLSYTRPFGRTFNDETGEVHLKYPIRFSAGLQEETFPNYTHGRTQEFRPYISINIF